jgi:hypothetical protein
MQVIRLHWRSFAIQAELAREKFCHGCWFGVFFPQKKQPRFAGR